MRFARRFDCDGPPEGRALDDGGSASSKPAREARRPMRPAQAASQPLSETARRRFGSEVRI